MADIANSKLFEFNTGIPNTEDACIVLVKTEWNAAVVDELEKGCQRILSAHHVRKIVTIVVPGAFEVPFAIRSYWHETGIQDRPQAFIALACIIRGDTPHFDYVCQGITSGIVQLNQDLPVPTIFGVLTVDNQQQADERIGGKHGHKGEEAALTALKMMSLQQSFRKQ